MPPLKNIAGQVFSRLTAVEEAGRTKNGKAIWRCVCECGNVCVATGAKLLSGRKRSCGCLLAEYRAIGDRKHGLTKGGRIAPEYTAFHQARNRCQNKNMTNYRDYGGRGIRFLLTSVESLVAEIGLRPSSRHSLDRINNNGHYESGNIHWATKREQCNHSSE